MTALLLLVVNFSLLLTLVISSVTLTSADINNKNNKNTTCEVTATEGTCYGHDLKDKYFLLANGFTNLNHGSFGTVPRPVATRQYEYYLEVESYPDTWFRQSYYEYIDKSRQVVADLIQTCVENLVLVENASSAVNSILRSIGLKRGDKVLRLSTAYGMVSETLDWLVASTGIEVVVVDIKFPLSSSEQIVTVVSDALAEHPDVKLCVFSHISSMPAVVEPIAELAAVVREIAPSALIVVDGAHAPGQIPVSVDSLGVDFYLGNCHKWLFAPKGTAFLWVSPAQQTSLSPEPTVISSSGQHDYIGRYAYTGTRDYTGFSTLPTAMAFREMLGGDDRIISYSHNLAATAGEILSQSWGTGLIAPLNMSGFMVNIILPSSDPDAVSYMRDTLETDYNTYIVYDRIPTDLVREDSPFYTGNDVYFTRLSAEVYLELSDFTQLADLVPELLKSAPSRDNNLST